MRQVCHWLWGAFWLMSQGVGAATVTVQVQQTGGAALAQAVVFLTSDAARRQVRALNQAELAQVGKAFVPQVLVVPVGTPVSFPNRDTVRHHVYSFSPTKKFELKLYIGTPAQPVIFDQPGVAVLGCNIHDQMVGWVVVVDTPWYAMSGPDGQVRLEGVPPGNYQLRVWHPGQPVGAAAQSQALQVPASAEVRLSVRLEGVRP